MSDGRYPILTDYDLGERVDLIFRTGGNIVANVPGVGLFVLGGGGPMITAEMFFFGAHNVVANADTRFMPWGYDSAALDTDVRQSVVLRNGTFSMLTVRHNIANGNGNSVEYRLFVNGAPTALVVLVPTGAINQVQDAVNSVAVVAGDLVSIRRTNALGIANGTVEAQGTILFGP